MKQRVVILSAFATPLRSGAEACSEEIARFLGDRYDILLVTARMRSTLPRDDVLPGGVRVHRVGLGMRFDKWLFPLLAPLAARAWRPALIHAVLESYAGAALLLCRWVCPGAKRVLTCQSTNTSFLLGPIHRAAHRVTVISSVLQTRAQGLGCSDTVLIPNGISLVGIAEARSHAIKVPGRILFVGRLEHMKGVDTLLRAFAAVVRKHEALPQAHLRIVGDGSQRPRLEALARELSLDGRVSFVGFVPVPHVFREFAQAEIFAGLSRSEALGNVFLEAQAAGCAVVGTTVGGIPDIVRDGVTGFLVPPDNPRRAQAALERLLQDSGERARLVAAGEGAARSYDWQAIADRYASVYVSLLR